PSLRGPPIPNPHWRGSSNTPPWEGQIHSPIPSPVAPSSRPMAQRTTGAPRLLPAPVPLRTRVEEFMIRQTIFTARRIGNGRPLKRSAPDLPSSRVRASVPAGDGAPERTDDTEAPRVGRMPLPGRYARVGPVLLNRVPRT